METPLISVIVPNYNGEKEVGRCLESIINQTYLNLEIIVVDDGSTDQSQQVYQQYLKKDNRIHLISQANQGLSMARNTGLSVASADYLTFVDSDDYLEKEMIQQLYESLITNKSDISVCGFFIASGSKKTEKKLDAATLDSKQAIGMLCDDRVLKNYAWGKLYRKELFKDVRYPVGKKFEDVDTTWRLFYNSEKIALTNYVGYNYEMRKESISHSHNIDSEISRIEAFYSCYQHVSTIYPEFSKVLLKRVIYGYFLLARSYVFATKTEREEIINKVMNCLQLVHELPNDDIIKLSGAEQKAVEVLKTNHADNLKKLLLLDLVRKIGG